MALSGIGWYLVPSVLIDSKLPYCRMNGVYPHTPDYKICVIHRAVPKWFYAVNHVGKHRRAEWFPQTILRNPNSVSIPIVANICTSSLR